MAENNPFPGENNTGHIWDDNLRELNNPPPRWWMIAFWASIIWWVAYGILYPTYPLGQKPNKGLLGWTMIKEYKESVAEVEAVRGKYEERLKGMDAKAILADPELKQYALASAKVIFGDKCAPCHGAGGQGNPGFPVLADDDWLYGGDINTIVTTVTGGRKGVMPAKGGQPLTEAEIDKLAQAEASGHITKEPLFLQKGCIACHGMDGKGLKPMGSANLTDSIWRFAPGGVESAKYTITHGVNDPNDPKTRNAEMPSFRGKLSKVDINKVAVYVHELGGGQ